MTSAADWILPSTKTQGGTVSRRDQGSSFKPTYQTQQPDSLQTFLRQNSSDKKPEVVRPKYHKQGSSTSNKQSDTPKYTSPSQPIPTLPGYSARLPQNSGLPLPGTKELARQNSYDLPRPEIGSTMRGSSLLPKDISPKKPSEDHFRNILRSSNHPYQTDKKGGELQKSSTIKTAKQTMSEIPSPTSQKTTRRNLKPVNFFDSNRLMDPTSYHNSELELTLTEYAKFNSGLKKTTLSKAQRLDPIEIKSPVVADDDFEAMLDDSLKFDETQRNRQGNKLFERPKPISTDIQHRRLQPAQITTKEDRERKRSQAKSARRHYEEDDEIIPARLDVSHSMAPTKNQQPAASWANSMKPSKNQGAYQKGLLAGEGASKPPSELSFQGFFGTGRPGTPQQQQQSVDHRKPLVKDSQTTTTTPKLQLPTKALASTQTETQPAEIPRMGMASQTDETYHQLRDTGKGMKERYQQRLRLKQLEEEALRKKNTPPRLPIIILPEFWEKFVLSKSEFNSILVKTLLEREVLEVRGTAERVRPAPAYLGILRDLFDEESQAELFPEDLPHPTDVFLKFQIGPAFAMRTICQFHYKCPPKKVNFGVQAGRLLPNPNLDVQHTQVVARSNLAALIPKNQASSAVIIKPVQLVPPVTPYIVRLAPEEHPEDDGILFFDEEDSDIDIPAEDEELLRELELAAFIPYLDLPNDRPMKWHPEPLESRQFRTCSPKPRRISVFVDEVKPLRFSLIDRFVHKDHSTPQPANYAVSRGTLRESAERSQIRNSQNMQSDRDVNPYKLKSFGGGPEFVSNGNMYEQPVRLDRKLTKEIQNEDSRAIQTEELHSWTEPDSQIANVSITAVLGNTYRKIPSYKGSNQSYWFEVVDQGELYDSRSQSQDQPVREIHTPVVIPPSFALLMVEYAVRFRPIVQTTVRKGPLTLNDFVPVPASWLQRDATPASRDAAVRISTMTVVRPSLNGTDTLWKCCLTQQVPIQDLPPIVRQSPKPLDLMVPGVDSIQKMLPIGVAPESKRLSFKGSPRNSSAEVSRPLATKKVVDLSEIRAVNESPKHMQSPKQTSTSRSQGPSEARPPAQPLVRWTPDWVSSLRKSPDPVGREQVQLSSDTFMKNKANFSKRVVYPARPS